MDCLLQHAVSPDCPHWQPGSVHVDAGVNTPYTCFAAGQSEHAQEEKN